MGAAVSCHPIGPTSQSAQAKYWKEREGDGGRREKGRGGGERWRGEREREKEKLEDGKKEKGGERGE